MLFIDWLFWTIFIIFWVLVGRTVFKANTANAQFERQLQQALQLVQSLQSLQPQQRAVQVAQLDQMLAQLNTQLSQFNRLPRQKYDVRMGELGSIAASAGINWTPPPYQASQLAGMGGAAPADRAARGI